MRRGRQENELTKFRYDAVLYLDSDPYVEEDLGWTVWGEDDFGMAQLRELLVAKRPETIGIRRVPNKRLLSDLKAWQLLEASGEITCAGELRDLQAATEVSGIDPEDLWLLGDELGYAVTVSGSGPGENEYCDVLFRSPDLFRRKAGPEIAARSMAGRAQPLWWSSCASNPLKRDLPKRARAYLEKYLPAHMIPGAFVVLERLPLSANGKLDRHALPEPEELLPEPQDPSVTPPTAVEELLAGIWAETLGRERVNICDNFFDLGGDSLVAIRVISQIRRIWNINLPVTSIFRDATVTGLAAFIERETRRNGIVPPVLQAFSHNSTPPLSFAQQRLWLLDSMQPGTQRYNVPMTVAMRGDLDVDALQRALQEILRRHEVLRTRLVLREVLPVQEVGEKWDFDLDVTDLRDLPPEQRKKRVEEIAAHEGNKPFNLAIGPLIRGLLLQTGEQEHVLVLTAHHIVVDGWSLGVLQRELGTIYEAFCSGERSPLRDLHVQYRDFAMWQRKWLNAEAIEHELKYWKTQLKGMPEILELPYDYARPVVTSHEGKTELWTATRELSDDLKRLGRSERVTLFMTLLAASAVLLSFDTNEEEIVVGTDVAGRQVPGTGSLIGFFVNQLVLRLDLRGDPTFRELLGRVREITLGAYAHQDLPFDRLVQELQPKRAADRTPLFQVKVAQEYRPLHDWVTPHLTMSSFALFPIAECDLALFFSEHLNGVRALVVYRPDLFEPVTIARMLHRLATVLGAVSRDSKIALGRLKALITQGERQQALAEENELGETSYRKLKTLRRRVAVPDSGTKKELLL